jgi:hypothetical protein
MPSSSKKQHHFMAAVANSPAFAKKTGVPQSVGKEFSNADKGRKFKEGGDTMATKMNAGFAAMMQKKKGGADALAKHAAKPASKAHKGLKSGGMTSMGAVKTAAPSKDGVATKGKTKGTMVTMKSGGKTC